MREKSIALFDLAASYAAEKQGIDTVIQRVLTRGVFILGDEVAQFEKTFSRYVRAKYGVAVASGTDALLLSLKALDVGTNNEVIVPANSYPTAFAVQWSGAKIKLADIDLATYTLDPTGIKYAITKNTRVIITVHLLGLPCAMREIIVLTKEHKLSLIEDAAQAHGATYYGRKVGSFGTLGCFSFYPTKNLGAFGDAGIVVTNTSKLAKKLRMLRMYGEHRRYQSSVPGTNSRLDELQAAILRNRLRRLDANNRRRRDIAAFYKRELVNHDLILPHEPKHFYHVYHIFAVRTKKRNELAQFLNAHNVATAVHYPIPVHMVKTFQFLGHKKGDFPNAEKASRELLSLPCHPYLSDLDVERVCHLVKQFFLRYHKRRDPVYHLQKPTQSYSRRRPSSTHYTQRPTGIAGGSS